MQGSVAINARGVHGWEQPIERYALFKIVSNIYFLYKTSMLTDQVGIHQRRNIYALCLLGKSRSLNLLPSHVSSKAL